VGRRRQSSDVRGQRDEAAIDLFPVEPPPARVESGRAGDSRQVDHYDQVGGGFPGASPASAVSVATVALTAKDILEGAFMPLWVRGEVSDFKAHRNGHWYFCLSDRSAQLRCVVWSRDRRSIPHPPEDGMQVTVLGQLTLYPARGDMQFAVRRIEAEGDGLWRRALERIRAKLEADGLLAPERKRLLPRHPSIVAVVTSPDGAALHDIAAVIARRAPHVRLVLVPAAVQGESAPRELCLALNQVARWGGADTVIVGRGGGARDDLRAFNDERVARALARCPSPTISAVGHEIDVTICDLVADHRAPTPSAAAEAAVRSSDELHVELRTHARHLVGGMAVRLEDAGGRLHRSARELSAASSGVLERRQTGLGSAAGRLHALSPLATLSRGYAIAQSLDGQTLASASDFVAGAEYDLRLRDGLVRSTVTSACEESLADDRQPPRT
jgi:exodeoxyribonuclease VII large subunit